MNTEPLYRKVMKGKRTVYEPVVDDEPVTVVTFTDAQCITAAGSLGAMLLMVFERNIPPHKVIARKIRAVEQAILDLYRGSGEQIDEEIADIMTTTWDRTMKQISAEHNA